MYGHAEIVCNSLEETANRGYLQANIKHSINTSTLTHTERGTDQSTWAWQVWNAERRQLVLLVENFQEISTRTWGGREGVNDKDQVGRERVNDKHRMQRWQALEASGLISTMC